MLDITFEGQKKDEEVMALFHKSPWAYGWSFALIGIIVILPIILMFTNGWTNVTRSLLEFGFVLAIILSSRVWYLWSNNIFLITDVRVIALTQEGLFNRRFQESYLDSICQVTAKVRGLLHSLFYYGDVLVQTEAEMWLLNIEQPYNAKHAIFEAVEQHKGSNSKLIRD